jgi:arylsulfatase A-like enzyme
MFPARPDLRGVPRSADLRAVNRPVVRQWAAWLLLGGLFGLLLFGIESALVLRDSAVGLQMDVKGPLAQLLAAVKPRLPGLLARVLLAYVLAGAALGLVSGVASRLLARGNPVLAWRLWPLELIVLFGLWAFSTAVHRPALFDDLPVRGALAWIVDHGEPWQPFAALGVWALLHVPLRRPSRAWAIAGVGLAVACGVWFAWPELARPHSLVVLIGIDAFRPDRVETRTDVAPNLVAFLKDATRFSRAYTPIAQTEPAWRSLLTARWPSRTGDRYPLTPESRWANLPTVPEALDRVGVSSEFVTDCSRFNYQDEKSGFLTRVEPPRGAVNFLLEKLRYRFLGMAGDNALGAWLVPEFVDNRALAGIYDPLGYASRLAGQLGASAAQGPLFFAFHDTAAHFPGDPVYPFYRRYLSPSEPLERRLRMVFSPVQKGSRGGWSREGSEALYDELLAQADAQVGVLLDSLKRRGLYDDAWIIVFSDHGESFYADHPDLQGATSEHGAHLSDEENRILLAVKRPRALGKSPATVDALVRLIDIGPTVLEALHSAPLPNVDGQSLLPYLDGKPVPPRRLYAETGFTHVTPDALDEHHWSAGPRTFDAYQILPDGRVEMTARANDAAMREKDIGAYDGKGWLIRSPRADGTVETRCQGQCDAALSAFLDQTR